MIGRAERSKSLHPDRLEMSRLAWALALSVALHALLWGGYVGGQKLGVWEKLRMPDWLKAVMPVAKKPKTEQLAPMANLEPPLLFLEVSPDQAVTDAPDDARFYSDKSSKAANTESEKDSNVPRIDGTQEVMAKTAEVKREDVNRLQPTPPTPPAPKAEKQQEQDAPKPKPEMGDLALAKPATEPKKETGQSEQPRPRPRTIQEAMSRQQQQRIPGQQMKQDGGVKRQALVPSLDAKATAFGAYDAAFIEAVSQRWYDLLDNRDYSMDRRGRVVLKFHLNYDGRVSNMQVMENTVGDTLGLICQKAVLDPSPFERWPGDMRRMVGANYREIMFTFYYN